MPLLRGLTAGAGDVLTDSRTGKNGWHGLVGLLRQAVYGRLAGYEDVNDADRLGRDPVIADVAVPTDLFADILRRIDRLRPEPRQT